MRVKDVVRLCPGFTPIAKLLVLYLLQNDGPVTIREAADDLAVSEKAVSRAVSAICTSGVFNLDTTGKSLNFGGPKAPGQNVQKLGQNGRDVDLLGDKLSDKMSSTPRFGGLEGSERAIIPAKHSQEGPGLPTYPSPPIRGGGGGRDQGSLELEEELDFEAVELRVRSGLGDKPGVTLGDLVPVPKQEAQPLASRPDGARHWSLDDDLQRAVESGCDMQSEYADGYHRFMRRFQPGDRRGR